MKDKDTELYNPKLKERFLENYTGQTATYYRNVFRRTKEKEEYYKKDISRFNRLEYVDFLRSLDAKSIGTLTSKNSVIQQYIRFAVSEGYAKQGQNINFDKKALQYYVSSIALEKKYIDEEGFMDLVRFCVNAQEKVIFALLWEGVMGQQCYEIRHLREKDVDKENNILTLTDQDRSTRKVSVSDFVMEIIQKAILESTYISHNGEEVGGDVYIQHLQDNGYIIKSTSKRTVGALTYMGIYRRITDIAEAYGNKYLTASNIKTSGMINYAKSVAIDGDTSKLTNSELRKIAKKYGYATTTTGLSTVRRTLAKASTIL